MSAFLSFSPSESILKGEKFCFPHRLRRMRQAPWIRHLIQEHLLSVHDLILPIFLREGLKEKQPIEALPGIARYGVEEALEIIREAAELGIPAVALFPYIDEKQRDLEASNSFKEDNLICQACRQIKAAQLNIGIICDVALDPYTSHGHDGFLEGGQVVNDLTIAALSRLSLHYAAAGADILAPSDMMDGRVKVIRHALEDQGFSDKLILSYAAKYASAFYGPFREALGNKDRLVGDKKTYQMDPANGREALREVELDIQEGADLILIKPGAFYLDIVHRVAQNFNAPIFAYQVSGEYAMICLAAEKGWISREQAIWESLIAFKRAGCSGIITYFALEIARLLKRGEI